MEQAVAALATHERSPYYPSMPGPWIKRAGGRPGSGQRIPLLPKRTTKSRRSAGREAGMAPAMTGQRHCPAGRRATTIAGTANPARHRGAPGDASFGDADNEQAARGDHAPLADRADDRHLKPEQVVAGERAGDRALLWQPVPFGRPEQARGTHSRQTRPGRRRRVLIGPIRPAAGGTPRMSDARYLGCTLNQVHAQVGRLLDSGGGIPAGFRHGAGRAWRDVAGASAAWRVRSGCANTKMVKIPMS